MNLDDGGQRCRFLIYDRDSKFSRAFDDVFRTDGMRVIRTPVRAPNCCSIQAPSGLLVHCGMTPWMERASRHREFD